MEVKALLGLGDFAANAYIVSSGKTAVLIDAPCDPDYISCELEGFELKAILLTHGHVDHISAAAKIREKTGCTVYISNEDMPMLTSSRLSLCDYFSQTFYPCDGAEGVNDGDVLSFGDLSFKVIATPGHTSGSVCYVADDVIFSGDTLFMGSIGRNFGSKAYSKIISSIGRLYELGKNYRVLSGHGAETDLYTELMTNPFLQDLRSNI